MNRLVLVAALAACNTDTSRERVDFANLSFDVPAGWTQHAEHVRGIATGVWTPEHNDKKESITILRTELAPATAGASASTLGALAEAAAAPLGATHVSRATPITTSSGLSGVRIESDYVPHDVHASYHRVHVVLVDGHSLVHVLYTARSADPSLSALDVVLDSIREEG